MENTEKYSTTMKSASPIDEPKREDIIDLTKDIGGEDATLEGGKSGGEREGGQGPIENRRMELTSGGDESKPRSSMSIVEQDSLQESTVEITYSEDLTENSSSTCIISPFFEGECEVATEEKHLVEEYVVEASNAEKNKVVPSVAQEKDAGHDAKIIRSFDLNGPPIDEDEADEKAIGNENSLPTRGVQGFDLNQQMEINEVEPMALKEMEVDYFVMEKTIGGGSAKIFNFDLNKPPMEIDEEWF